MKRSAEEAGRDPASIEITAGAGQGCDADTVKRYQDLGVSRVMIGLPTQDPGAVVRFPCPLSLSLADLKLAH